MYTPLYIKSCYNILSSLIKIDDIICFAKENNLNAISICDTNMYGVYEFYKKCISNNIKPIIGLNINTEEYNYLVFAKDYDGYISLSKLSTILNTDKLSKEDIKKYNNLICILEYKYINLYDDLKNIYSDIYIGYSNSKEKDEAILFTKNIIYINEKLYLYNNDYNYLSYLCAIRDNKTIKDNLIINKNNSLYDNNIITDKLSINNLKKIIDSINIIFPKYDNILPNYNDKDPDKYLYTLAHKGCIKRCGYEDKKYIDRLNYELNIIKDMGFSNYFLIVYDYVLFAKKNNILVGPGRGSAVGSLVSYSLGITDIDPIEYDLLFERFLNPERKSMPDIDIDFPDDRRDEVINYVINKYGKKNVAGILTIGTLASKQVIRDVSRVLNIPLYKVDSLVKYIDNSNILIKDILKDNILFKNKIEMDNSLKKMIDISIKLEGLPRHLSQHASGIVISKYDLDNIIPLTKGDNYYLTSYTMNYLEDFNLLKMDFLGLKNLSLINNIITDINNNLDKDISFSNIKLSNDYIDIFKNGDTLGIFQFESHGMREFLKKLKPENFLDISSAIALYRPGASISIDSYIKRKHHEEEITYLDSSLKDITKDTYGLLIYQEQIIKLANVFAGYTLGEADILRRAISKKKLDLLKKEEEKFIKKSMENKHPLELSKNIFNLVLKFASYGFNKSHSIAYASIAYKMAYLKKYYRSYFYTSILNNVIGIFEKTYEIILEVKKNKIDIVKPNIKYTNIKYEVKDNKILFPISNIKGIGIVTSKNIYNELKDKEINNIYEAFIIIYKANINKKIFEVLIKANYLDCFNYNRKTLLYNLDNLYNYAELIKDLDEEYVEKPEIIKKDEFTNLEIAKIEKEIYGFYFSYHPVSFYRNDNIYAIKLSDISLYLNKQVDILLLVEKVKVINTKNNMKMAFITGSDEYSKQEVVLFPNIYNEYEDISINMIIKVRGIVERRLNTYQVIAKRVKYLEVENEKE